MSEQLEALKLVLDIIEHKIPFVWYLLVAACGWVVGKITFGIGRAMMSRPKVIDPLPSPIERFNALIAKHKAPRENANVNKQVNQPIVGQRWQHRSGHPNHVYTIVCVACFVGDCTDAVVYRNVETWVMPLGEFLERYKLVGDR
jgi:hypothetical protein